MADCVVPQEYGTTVEEKSSVGVKICHGLLEKLKYDLGVARTDNNTDMRYLINMEYSLDLPINTMGRRIRTRLYFTSESHLHTVLNVLRFAKCHDGCKSLLSEQGMKIINGTPELCYLTQIVMRVFEDSRRDINDPRRFRVELLFSPGATATPFHMDEFDRDADLSRFDTAPLQKIGRDDLTCEDVEAFFEGAIRAGRSDDEVAEAMEVMSSTTAAELVKAKKLQDVNKVCSSISSKKEPAKPQKGLKLEGALTRGRSPLSDPDPDPLPVPVVEVPKIPTVLTGVPMDDLTLHTEVTIDGTLLDNLSLEASRHENPKCDLVSTEKVAKEDETFEASTPSDPSLDVVAEVVTCNTRDFRPDAPLDISSTKKDEPPPQPSVLSRKFFWSSVAIGSLSLGVGLLFLAIHRNEDSRSRRRWSKR